VYVHYIPLPIHVYVSVCLSVYLSSVCMLVGTVSCQSVTLVSHTTCLSFVNVYIMCTCTVHVRPSVMFMCTISHHYMSVSRTVTPCPAHVFLSSFLYLYASTPAYPSHSYAQCLPYVFVCLCFLRPCVRISCSQLCVRVSVYHIHVYYTSLSYISTTVCRSTRLYVCLFSCEYITCVAPRPVAVALASPPPPRLASRSPPSSVLFSLLLVRLLTGPDVSDTSTSAARSRSSERPTCNFFGVVCESEGYLLQPPSLSPSSP